MKNAEKKLTLSFPQVPNDINLHYFRIFSNNLKIYILCHLTKLNIQQKI